ncbi:MAG: hypothetical protein Q3976_05505 [Corynebacterium sp.]|nr:hypothetical protein [Corynebacterium sp.]
MPNLIFLPNSPAVLSELSPSDESSVELKDRAMALVRSFCLNQQPVVIHYAEHKRDYTALTGSLKAWGAQVTVATGNFLPQLLARYILESAGWDPAMVRARGYSETPDLCTKDALAADALHVMVLDGVAALTTKAPKYVLPQAEAGALWCRETLGGELPEQAWTRAQLEQAGVDNAVLWPALWQLRHQTSQLAMRSFFEDTTHGVARLLGAWEINNELGSAAAVVVPTDTPKDKERA